MMSTRCQEDVYGTPFQIELARLLKISTITPGSYVPSDNVRHGMHAAVFVNGDPVILCGPSNDSASVQESQALARSSRFSRLCKKKGLLGVITDGYISGKLIKWNDRESAIVKSTSGEVELGNQDGDLVAIVLNDPNTSFTAAMCVITEIAKTFDSKAPELCDGSIF
jgi:hypothetical protein